MKKIALAACLAFAPAPIVAQTAQSISASDKATGAKAHPDLVRQFGGALKGPQADYVERVGRRVAVQSGLSGSERDFTVTLLDSPVNNAFAIPGGYIYVTRGLLALVDDEAELASVLGHEVGHVAARHADSRQRTSTITGVLAGLVGAVAGNSGLGSLVGRGAGLGADLITKGFSRSQEYQADDLGVRYLAGAGYDPFASSDMLALLGAQESLDARVTGRDTSIPTWASTHPNSQDRVERARQRAQQTGASRGQRNRDALLNAIDGMVYGEDPSKGYLEGQVFRLPAERLAFTVPGGFTLDNGDAAVTIGGSGGRAIFSGGMIGAGGITGYVSQVFRGLSQNGVAYGDIQRTRINGIDMSYAFGRANSSAGMLDVGVFAFPAEDMRRAYSVVTLAPAGQGAGPVRPLVDSLRRLSPQEAVARPMRLQVVTVKAGDTAATLARRMAFPDYQLDRFLVLNGLANNAVLKPGDRVKIVVR